MLPVDLMMDPLSKQASMFRTFGEHRKEALLSQLAEPLQFLHTLDLVHILEFYYRYNTLEIFATKFLWLIKTKNSTAIFLQVEEF